MVAAAAVRAVAPQRPARRHRAAGLAALTLCALLAGAGLLASAPSHSFATPAAAGGSSRRAAAAGTVAALLGGSAAWAEERPGTASLDNDIIDYSIGRDSPEVIEKRQMARVQAAKDQEQYGDEFRAVFADFASEAKTIDEKIEIMSKMQDMILAKKMLPLTVTRDDVTKGVRAVKFNLGCIKRKVKEGDCKKLEKKYQKLLATIDKVYDRSVLSATAR